MEIQVFRNRKSSQTNANLYYSNYSYSGLIPNERALNFEEVVKEIPSQCPKFYKILSQMVQLCIDPDEKKAPLALIYGIIMFKRCKELSLVQRVNTVLLNDGGASQEVCLVLPCSADCSVLFTCYNKKQCHEHFLYINETVLYIAST